MKEIVIISYVNPKSIRGLQVVAINYAKELKKEGYNVSIFSRGEAIESFYLDDIQINTYKFPKKTNFIKGMLDERIECRNAWRIHYKNRNLLAVNGHDYIPYIFINNLLSKSVKKFFTVHDPFFYHQRMLGKISDSIFSPKRYLAIYIEKKIEKISDITYVISEYTNQRMVVKKEINHLDRKLMNDWIDLEKYNINDKDKNHLKKMLGLDETKFTIFTLRALEKRMGIDNLIKGFDLFNKKFENSMLIIGGKGPEEKNLKDLVKEINNSNIIFLGYIPDDDVINYYNATDLFVLPSIDGEGFGLPILEAMACGTPVLGTPVCAIPEVLNEKKDRLLEGVEAKDIFKGIEKIYLEVMTNNINRIKEREYVVKYFNGNKIIKEFIRDVSK